ncbi:PAS domain-containing protein [uncultured Jannaschia sp.]|uniref:PAS domain-containing protein n=1 Tax=uncultured Jannaschia sp. TaxID=293347 RepID=UPI002627B19B|nr:PAS domain-containing protein [uncultured Jannaschia sp.]
MTKFDGTMDEMTGRGPSGLRTMRTSPILNEAMRYWNTLREGADLPRRTALDPRAMSHIIGHAMILDRVHNGAIRARLGGHVMNDLMGMDVRGLPVRAFFELRDRDRAVELVNQVFETPASLEMDLLSQSPTGALLTGRMLFLPLLDSAGAPTKALSVLVTDRVVSDPPRRFGITNATMVPLQTASMRAMPACRAAPASDLPEEMRPEETGAPAMRPSSVPWLRVVK